MSAFLIAIVAGNGINSGLMLLARFYEELRAGEEQAVALAAALSGAARGTLAAALSAGVAYGALAVTEFRGFRHFGIIGSIGMVLSWLSAFTILPAGLCVLGSWGRSKRKSAPFIDRIMARITPSRPQITVTIGLFLLVASALLTVRFALGEPFEKDWRNLRSESEDIAYTKKLDDRMRESVGRKFGAGLTSRFVVAVDDVAAMPRAREVLKAAPSSLLKSVTSLQDLLPSDQDQKLGAFGQVARAH